MHKFFNSLNKKDRKVFSTLDSPVKIQNFLETIPKNFEKQGYTIVSPVNLLKVRKAHCFEGALFAAACFHYHGKRALLMDLKAQKPDNSHVLAIFKEGNNWGAISKSNHAVLRFRDPVYKSIHELALSYFHEYFLDNGRKSLRSYAVLDMKSIKKNWITDKDTLWYVDEALDNAKHIEILPRTKIKKLRKADPIERRAGKLTIWKKKNAL